MQNKTKPKKVQRVNAALTWSLSDDKIMLLLSYMGIATGWRYVLRSSREAQEERQRLWGGDVPGPSETVS